jgi:hypothetical protein
MNVSMGIRGVRRDCTRSLVHGKGISMNRFLAASAWLCFGLNVWSPALAEEEDFRPVSFRDGGFSVEMPAHPELSSQPLTSEIKLHLLKVKDYQGAGYWVGYLDLPGDLPGDNVREKIKMFRGALRSELEMIREKEVTGVSQGGNKVPGVETLWKDKSPEGKLRLREQLFLQHRRFYSFVVIGSEAAVDAKDAEFFFQSVYFGHRGERQIKLPLDKLSNESQAALAAAAPGVQWEEATLTKGATAEKGKLVETNRIRVAGKDARRHEVVIVFQPGEKIEETATYLDFQELPTPVQKTALARGETFGNPALIAAVGPTTTKIEHYRLSYAQGGVMIVSPDGKKVELLGLD